MTLTASVVQMVKGDLAYSKIDSEDEAFSILKSEMWGTSDTVYVVSQVGNGQIKMGTKEYLESEGMDMYSENLLIDIDSELFTDVFFTKVESGYEIKVNFDSTKYLEMLKNTSLSSLVSSLSAEQFKSSYYTIGLNESGEFTYVVNYIEYEEGGYNIVAYNNMAFKNGCENMPSLPDGHEDWEDYTSYFK